MRWVDWRRRRARMHVERSDDATSRPLICVQISDEADVRALVDALPMVGLEIAAKVEGVVMRAGEIDECIADGAPANSCVFHETPILCDGHLALHLDGHTGEECLRCSECGDDRPGLSDVCVALPQFRFFVLERSAFVDVFPRVWGAALCSECVGHLPRSCVGDAA